MNNLALILFFMSLRGSPIRRLQLFSREANSQFLTLQAQNDRLTSQLHLKNIQLHQLYIENTSMKVTYEEKIQALTASVSSLEQKLRAVEGVRSVEFQVIREKYDRLSKEESESIKNYHSHEVEFLLREIAGLRVESDEKDRRISAKQKEVREITQSFEREIEEKINEINSLNRNLMSIEDVKNKQIREINSKRELQKSRNSGIVSSRKQNNQFMDKQMRKLNQQLLEKAIKVENLSREINKIKRRYEQNQKAMIRKLQNLITEKQQEAKDRQQHFAKIQKSLKQQIVEFKSKELQYLGEIDSLKTTVEALRSQIKHYEGTVQSKNQQIQSYRDLLQKQREDHSKQISNLMKQRRRRSSNLGSSRSLGSSLKDASTPASEQLPASQLPASQLRRLDSIRLPTVKQQSPDKSLSPSLQHSHLSQSPQQQAPQLLRLMLHYDTLIHQLKLSHNSQLQLLKLKLTKLTKSLEEKQHQLLDMLTRFSPLVKIHAEEKSVEEDRRERIERHWRADLGLLEIMLQRYGIRVCQ